MNNWFEYQLSVILSTLLIMGITMLVIVSTIIIWALIWRGFSGF